MRNLHKKNPRGCHNLIGSRAARRLVQESKNKRNKFATIKSSVREFYLDDENSTTSPGKKRVYYSKKTEKREKVFDGYFDEPVSEVSENQSKYYNIQGQVFSAKAILGSAVQNFY